ncbi:MAG TPA: NAD(P)-dependent oxidoreductase [Methylocella sp.]|nr:NAD(P)-dependent oxidoreductase [Methylocella sp.]
MSARNSSERIKAGKLGQESLMEIGMIGLGQMGMPIARNLLKAGHRLTVYNRTRAKAEALAGEGSRIARTVAEVCQAEVLITLLTDDAAVESVVFGVGGILDSLPGGSIHLSITTISVVLSERLLQSHLSRGQVFAVATVFGRPEVAAAAALFIVAAGPNAALVKCQPLFEAIGQRSFNLSERPADANLVKLAGNFLIGSVIESLGEGIALVRKAGIDPHRFVEILTGSLFAAPVYKTYGEIIANETYEPAGFKMPLGLKDIRLALAAAEALHVPLPVASLLRDHFLSGLAQGGAESDWAALARVSAKNAGL